MHNINIRLLQEFTKIVIPLHPFINFGKGAVQMFRVNIAQCNNPAIIIQMTVAHSPAANDGLGEFIGGGHVAPSPKNMSWHDRKCCCGNYRFFEKISPIQVFFFFHVLIIYFKCHM